MIFVRLFFDLGKLEEELSGCIFAERVNFPVFVAKYNSAAVFPQKFVLLLP